jgi:hypothetical protein
MNIKTEGEEPDVSFGPVSLEAYLASGSKQTHIRTMNNIHPSHLEGWYLPSFSAFQSVRTRQGIIYPRFRLKVSLRLGFVEINRQNDNNGVGWQ